MLLPDGTPTPAELADALSDQLPAGAEVIVPIANGEPVRLLDELEARADRLDGVRIHQMHALRDRPYLHGACSDHLRHVSWFLSHVTRPAFHEGGCDLVPANFSEVPTLMAARAPEVVLAAASPPDRHGYYSLGVSADYTAALIGKVPFVLEVNERMPRTHGTNRLHRSEVLAVTSADYGLVEVPDPDTAPLDCAIAERVVERIPDGATIQLGIGSIPTALASFLGDHKHLGVHTELLSTPVVDLIEAGAVTGLAKSTKRGRVVTTFALGTQRLYDFCDRNDMIQFLPVDEVADPRMIGRERCFVSVNATLEVDLFGQCASESIGSRYWSGSGGQYRLRPRRAVLRGWRFVVLHSTTSIPRCQHVPTLRSGAVVTTLKNTVDNVVTEHGWPSGPNCWPSAHEP
ncbi:MAG: acetyl-CoA hydrolase/transferase C-terminal domain-containing protein [Microthrixaceae bacterium]